MVTNSVFKYLVNEAAFVDTLVMSVWTREKPVLEQPACGESSRNPEAAGLAHASSHVWNAHQSRGCGRCDYASVATTCKRQRHPGPLRPSDYRGEAGSTITGREDASVPKRSHEVDGNNCNCLNRKHWALNSAVECHLHTVEVIGSNPIAPTILLKTNKLT
jgi:hypothetical protein